MTFRDDREAAHRRADALERELQSARAELDAIKKPRQRSTTLYAVLGATFAVSMVGALTFFMVARGPAVTPTVAVTTPGDPLALEAQRAAAEAEEARHRLETEQEAARSAQEAARVAQQAAALGPPRHITWHGQIDAAQDVELVAGMPCTLEVDAQRGPNNPVLQSLVVRCGPRVLYRSTDEVAPPSTPRFGLQESPTFGQGRRYLFRLEDEAARTSGRPRASISTMQHRVRVWREGDGAFDVTMFVRDVSDPQVGDAIRPDSRATMPVFQDVIDAEARVTRVTGHAPVARGAQCLWQVRPVWEFPESCRIALRCGETWLYGARESGFLACEVRGSGAVGALDENPTAHGGDPRLRWRGRQVTVSDYGVDGEWSVELAVP